MTLDETNLLIVTAAVALVPGYLVGRVRPWQRLGDWAEDQVRLVGQPESLVLYERLDTAPSLCNACGKASWRTPYWTISPMPGEPATALAGSPAVEKGGPNGILRAARRRVEPGAPEDSAPVMETPEPFQPAEIIIRSKRQQEVLTLIASRPVFHTWHSGSCEPRLSIRYVAAAIRVIEDDLEYLVPSCTSLAITFQLDPTVLELLHVCPGTSTKRTHARLVPPAVMRKLMSLQRDDVV